MSPLLSTIRRKRRGQPVPADFMCPHCGRRAGAVVPAETIEPLPAVPVLADGHLETPDKSKADDGKNVSKIEAP